MVKTKVKTLDEIKNIAEDMKRQGKMVVTCNGTFDVLHVGHIRFLREAKRRGDVLIVGLNSDKSVRMNKGPNRPINNRNIRAEFLSALEPVDYIVIFNEKDPRKLLSAIKPNVHVNGEEYGYNCIEAPVVKRHGGRIYLVKRYGSFSTTKLINKAYGGKKR